MGQCESYHEDNEYIEKMVACNQLGDVDHQIIEALKKNPELLRSQPLKIRSDKFLMKKSVEVAGECLQHVSDNLKEDKEMVKMAVKNKPRSFVFAADCLKNNEEFLMELFETNPFVVEFFPKKFLSNRMFMEKIVRNQPVCFKYASKKLQDNEDFVLLAVEKNGEMWKFASDRLKKNKKIILAAVKEYPRIWERLDENLFQIDENNETEHKKFLLEFMKLFPLQHYYKINHVIPEEYESDENFVKSGIENYPKFILVNDCFKKNEEYWKIALRKDGLLLQECTIQNEELVEIAVKQNPEACTFCSLGGEDVKKKILTWNGLCLEFFKEISKEHALISVNQDGGSLRYCPSDLCDDEEIVMAAITNDGKSLQFASYRLRSDKKFVMKATENGYKTYYPDPEMYDNDVEICWKFVRKYHKVIGDLPKDIQFKFFS